MGERTHLILLDTDIFVIDEIFIRDKRHASTARLLERSPPEAKATSIFNVLEFCGIVAAATKRDIKKTFAEFHEVKGVRVLYPRLMGNFLPFAEHLDGVLDRIQRGIRYGDANILLVAEENGVDQIITWNKRHYQDKTEIEVKTPDEVTRSFQSNKP